MIRYRNILYCIVLALITTQCACPKQSMKRREMYCKEPVVVYSVNGEYDDVWDDLKMALGERGLVISSVSHVGDMIDRTGKALGRTKKVYGKAEVMEFCSAVLSRDMFEKNPHLLPFCPYQIMVYTLHDNPQKVYLSYKHLLWNDDKDQDVLDSVEELVEEIIRDVIEIYKE